MGRKPLAVVFAVLGLAGLAVVPGYWAYARYVAGEELASFDVYGGDKPLPGAGEGAGALTFPARDDQGWRTPVRIGLSPEMSPVLLRLNISSRPPLGPGEHSIRYQVTLRSAARSLIEETVVFTEERGQERERGTETAVLSVGGRSTTVAVFDVAEAGDYALDVEDIGQASGLSTDRLKVDRVGCVFRRNCVRINPWVCAAGLALFVAGSVGFVAFSGIRRIKR